MLRHFGPVRNAMLEFLQVRHFTGLLLVLSLAIPAEARRRPTGDVVHPNHLHGETLMRQRALRKLAADRQRRAAAASTNQDFGNIAVMQDDGTLFSQPAPFNLANQSVMFSLSSGAYTVTNVPSVFDTTSANAGQAITLADDDTHFVALPFAFTFYGQTYSGVYVNSDGNLTFGTGDFDSSDRDLGRALVGPPRLMPFFQDLNPAEGGTVTVNVQSTKAVISWLAVPLCCTETLTPPVPQQTFQVILFANGNIQFNYGAVQSSVAGVGISPGGTGSGPGAMAAAADEIAFSSSGALVEVYDTAVHICISCVALKFYATHEDAYDTLMTWTSANYSFSLGADTFAQTNPIKNDITGIVGTAQSGGAQTWDSTRFTGSNRLQTVIEMGALAKYGANPNAPVGAVGSSTSFTVMSHEIGHRWLSYVFWPDATNPESGDLLDTPMAHWSFLFNDNASFMLGDKIQNNNNGSFTTIANTQQYGPLDQYLMGLIGPSQVPDSFLVTGSQYSQNTYPVNGVMFNGTAVPVTVAQIIQANGARLPPATMTRKSYNVAIIYILAQGATLNQNDVTQLQNFQATYDNYWNSAAGGNGTMHTELMKAARIAPSPVAAGSVTTTVQASINLQSPAPAGGATFQLTSSDSGIVKVPASVTVAAGATQAPFSMIMGNAGTATVTATSPGYETAVAPVASTMGAAVNGASFAAGYAVSAGSIASFFGPFLTPSTVTAAATPLPTALGNVSATVNGVAVPLFYVSPGQINFQVPFSTQGSYANLAVTTASGPVLNVPLLLNAAAPGIFFNTDTNLNHVAAALHGATGLPITTASPAHAGEVISLFVTGLGAVLPSVASGAAAPASPLSTTTLLVTATVGSKAAAVQFAGLAPSFVGLYQVNLQIPSNVATGANVPVVITAASTPSNPATIAIQ